MKLVPGSRFGTCFFLCCKSAGRFPSIPAVDAEHEGPHVIEINGWSPGPQDTQRQPGGRFESRRPGTGRSHSQARSALVTAQVAMTIVLLVGGSLLARSLVEMLELFWLNVWGAAVYNPGC